MAEWINRDVKIDFKVPKCIRYLMQDAEKFEAEGDYAYLEVADTIDVMAKNYCAEGLMTQEQWDRLVERYPQ